MSFFKSRWIALGIVLLGALPLCAATPVLLESIPAQSLEKNRPPAILDLSQFFDFVEEDLPPFVRIEFGYGDSTNKTASGATFGVYAEIFDLAAPNTSAAFLEAADRGLYHNNLVYRYDDNAIPPPTPSTRTPGKAIFTGRFPASTWPEEFSNFKRETPIPSEYTPTPANAYYGTLTTEITSATDTAWSNTAWRINISLNQDTSVPSTVFAKIVGDGMVRIETMLADTPPYANTANKLPWPFLFFYNLPLYNYSRTPPYSSTPIKDENLMRVDKVSHLTTYPRHAVPYGAMNFTATPADTTIATCSFEGSLLLVDPLKEGSTTITVRATSVTGEEITTTFAVTVAANPNNFTTFVAGQYNNILGTAELENATYDDALLVLEDTGLLRFSLTATGKYSGKLELGGNKYSFRGKFDKEGKDFYWINRGSDAMPLVLTFYYEPATGASSLPRVTGRCLVNLTTSFSLPLAEATVKKSLPHPLTDHIATIALPSPIEGLGHGFANIKINKKGLAKIKGKLADGTTLSISSYAIRTDKTATTPWTIPAFFQYYKKISHIFVAPIEVSPNFGTQTASPTAWLSIATGGWTLFPLDVFATQYRFTKNTPLIPSMRFLATIENPAAASPLLWQLAGHWPSTNKPSFDLKTDKSLSPKISFTSSTGAFSGNLKTVLIVKDKPKVTTLKFYGTTFSSPLIIDGSTLYGMGYILAPDGTSAPVELEKIAAP